MPLRHKLLMLFLMSAAFLVVGQLYLTLPLTGMIATAYPVTPAKAALVGSLFGLAYAAGFLILGLFSDRWGRKKS